MSLDAIFSLVICATFLGIYVMWLLARRVLGKDFQLWKFKSQVASASFLLVLLCVSVFLVAFAVFKLGGCQGGMTEPIECKRVSNRVGDTAFFTYLVLVASSPAIFLGCFIVGAVYERRVRRT